MRDSGRSGPSAGGEEPPALEVEGVSKRYDGLAALDAVDLAIPAARTTVLLGASGSGKSTLLRVLLGLVPPDDGCVRVQGETLGAANVLGLRRRMGYVIQDGGLFPHLTARENATLAARELGWSEARRSERLAALGELVQLAPELLDRYPVQLSGGQRQRVGLLRALMLDPPILLLDEPLGALDPITRADLQQDLRGIFRELGKSVVLVTHDLAEAGFFAHQVVLFHEGAVHQRGPFVELVREPADDYVTRFVRAQRAPLDALREADS